MRETQGGIKMMKNGTFLSICDPWDENRKNPSLYDLKTNGQVFFLIQNNIIECIYKLINHSGIEGPAVNQSLLCSLLSTTLTQFFSTHIFYG